MNNKKVAFCFSGQARTLDLCYPYIKKNLLDPLGENKKDYDIFCCVEDDKDSFKIDLLNPTKVLKVSSKDFSKDIKKINKLNYRKIFCRKTRQSLNDGFNQLTKIFLSNQLKEQYKKEKDLKYDWVFRIRFDIFPLDKIDYAQLNPKFVYVIPRLRFVKKSLNDMIAIGSEDKLNIYSNQINELYDTINLFLLKNITIPFKISFFIEKIYTNFFEFFLKRLKKGSFFYKLINTLAMGLREFIFLSPPLDDFYGLETGLFRYLNRKKIRTKILPIDFIVVRDKIIKSIFISPRKKELF